MLKTVNKDISSIIDTLNGVNGNLLCIDKSLKGLESLSLPFPDYDVNNLPYELSFLHDCIVDCSGELSLVRAQLDNFICAYDVCICEQNTPKDISCDDLSRIDNGLKYLSILEDFFLFHNVDFEFELPRSIEFVHFLTNLLEHYRDVVTKLSEMGEVTRLD